MEPSATIARVFEKALARDPAAEALVTRTRRLSYDELEGLSNRAAHALAELGVKPGDRVAASLPNEWEVVVAFHGAMRLGAVWVGVNKVLAPPERQFLLDDSGSRLLLAEPEVVESAQVGATLTTALTTAMWREALDAAPSTPWTGADIDPFAPAGLAYTSGTTGRPKGAVHSQHNLLLPGAVLVETRGYGPELRKGDCFPFTILNMAVLTTLLVSQAGGTSIVMDRMDAQGVAEWIRRERVTTWNGPPALLHSLAHHDDVSRDDLASLREVWTGGADCPEVIRRAFGDKFGTEVLATYGLSEAPTVVSIDDVGGATHREGASGRVLPHLAVRIAGPDGTTQPPGETGEIRVSAADDRYRTMLGYWARPDATAETLEGGELHTGDLGFVDEDGFLHLRDRASLLIIRGGANVYPAEVERVLLEYPGVGAAAVLGIADERLGERVMALIEVTDPTVEVESIRAHLLANLARYKVPERIVVVGHLPRNAMGKIVRKDLSELLYDV